jgi:hypothetical protein
MSAGVHQCPLAVAGIVVSGELLGVEAQLLEWNRWILSATDW